LNSINYKILDELEDAVHYGVRNWSGPVGEIRCLAHALYFYRSVFAGLLNPEASAIIVDDRFDVVGRYLTDGRRDVLTGEGRSWGIGGTESGGRLADELAQYALSATKRSTMPTPAAHQVISALGEFHSNIIEHSGDRSNSFIGFEVTDHFVGVYATDFGMGTLSTLQQNPRYRSLSDHGDSLKLAIQDGVTCTGQVDRGLGFRPIFEGLTNRTGYLRFRSGDALLEISGIKRDDPSLQIKQRPAIKGFHIYVHCEL
jgi:hypothetical protein